MQNVICFDRTLILVFLASISRIGSTCASLAADAALDMQGGKGRAVTLSREQGERRLHDLAATESTEDSWIFVRGCWINVGVARGEDEVECDLTEILAACIPHDVSDAPAMWYHIHPKKNREGELCPPSSIDVVQLVRVNGFLREALRGGISGHVLDGLGAWDFEASSDLQSSLSESSSDSEDLPRADRAPWTDVASMMISPKARSYSLTLAFTLKYESLVIALGNPSLPRAQRVARFIESARDLGVEIHFRQMASP